MSETFWKIVAPTLFASVLSAILVFGPQWLGITPLPRHCYQAVEVIEK